MLVRRIKRPTRVTRGSLVDVKYGPMDAAFFTMLRNFNMPNSRPCRPSRV